MSACRGRRANPGCQWGRPACGIGSRVVGRDGGVVVAAAAAVVETAGSAVVANGCQNNQNCVQTKLEISGKRPSSSTNKHTKSHTFSTTETMRFNTRAKRMHPPCQSQGVDPYHGHRGPSHVQRRHEGAAEHPFDPRAPRLEVGRCPTSNKQQLHRGCGPEGVDENGDALVRGQG